MPYRDEMAGMSLWFPLEAPNGTAPANTRRAARESIEERADTLRAAVLAALARGPMTADEVAIAISETVLATRPRLTELHQDGRIYDMGARRPNASGRNAIVWGRR